MFRLMRERPHDEAEVEALLDLAFAPGRAALSSYQLRDGVASIGALNTVARDEFDIVIGAIRFWPVVIGDLRKPALLLGPIAVHPTRQGEGVGKLLIRQTLDGAAALTWERILLIGDEDYYARFGFTSAATADMTYPPPYNPQRLLGCALREGAFQNCSGMIRKFTIEDVI